LSEKNQRELSELQELTDSDRSWRNYRAYLRTLNPPCVPFFGVYQTDLTFIDEGNKTVVNSLINFKKCRLIAGVIKEIQQ
jgi:son of sevenless-like protein